MSRSMAFSGIPSFFESLQRIYDDTNSKDASRWRKIMSHLENIDFMSKIRGRESEASVMLLPSTALEFLARRIEGDGIPFLGDIPYDIVKNLVFPTNNIKVFEGIWIRICLDMYNSLDPNTYKYNSKSYLYIRLDDTMVNQEKLIDEISNANNYYTPVSELKAFYAKKTHAFTFGLNSSLFQKIVAAGLYRHFSSDVLNASIEEQDTYYHRLASSVLSRYFDEYRQFQKYKGSDQKKTMPPVDIIINIPDILIRSHDSSIAINSLDRLQAILKTPISITGTSEMASHHQMIFEDLQWYDIIALDKDAKMSKIQFKLRTQKDIKYELDYVYKHDTDDKEWIMNRLKNILYQIDTTVDDNVMKNLVESFQHPIIPLLIILHCLNAGVIFKLSTNLRQSADVTTEFLNLKEFNKITPDPNIKASLEMYIRQAQQQQLSNDFKAIESVLLNIMKEFRLTHPSAFDTVWLYYIMFQCNLDQRNALNVIDIIFDGRTEPSSKDQLINAIYTNRPNYRFDIKDVFLNPLSLKFWTIIAEIAKFYSEDFDFTY